MDRINKYIASCGICSRRKAEEYVLAGRVKVNDIIIKDLAYKVKEEDIIKIDDNIINKEERKVYIMLNKPKGYVTTSHEQFGRKSVLDLIDNSVIYNIFGDFYDGRKISLKYFIDLCIHYLNEKNYCCLNEKRTTHS